MQLRHEINYLALEPSAIESIANKLSSEIIFTMLEQLSIKKIMETLPIEQLQKFTPGNIEEIKSVLLDSEDFKQAFEVFKNSAISYLLLKSLEHNELFVDLDKGFVSVKDKSDNVGVSLGEDSTNEFLEVAPKPMKLSAIFSITDDMIMGTNGDLMYRERNDMRNFRKLTTDNIVVMGAGTFLSLDSKPLPNRLNIVLSKQMARNPQTIEDHPGFLFFEDTEELEDFYRTEMRKEVPREFFVIGGSGVLTSLWPHIYKVHLTTFKTVCPISTPEPTYFGLEEFKSLQNDFGLIATTIVDSTFNFRVDFRIYVRNL